MADSAISSVVRLLGSQVIEESKFLRGIPEQVEYIKIEFNAMQSFLKDADSKGSKGDNRVANWIKEVRDVAYEAENVIAKIDWMERWKNHNKGFLDRISWYANHYSIYLKFLHKIGKEIRTIRKKIDEISTRRDRYGITNLGESSLDNGEANLTRDDLNRQREVSPSFECKDDFPGFDNDIEKIIEELTDPLELNEDLQFVSLVGMGGIGKSTLARKVFMDPKIRGRFNTSAWISVSQSYRPIEILKDIMKKTMNIKKENLRNEIRNENVVTEQELENMPEHEVREMLHEFLRTKKYLIVLDDVWTKIALDRISYAYMVFPNSNNGSRIILTTRHTEVANHPNYTNHIHNLKLWDDEKSWAFLHMKAIRFPNQLGENTLKELESVGKELARKCKGLPLALSVLGGFLSKNIDLSIWLNMVNSLNWGKTSKNVVEILALSFHDLQHNLKSCFLYMASFPEDHLTSASTLIRMWIAEGFLPFNYNCSQQETARKYLNELAHRSMLQVVEVSKTHGWIKRVRIHDILRDFCIAESANIGFLKICDNHADLKTFMSDGMTTYRVAFSKLFSNNVGMCMPNLRTLIGFGLTEPSFSVLNYLRVLELVHVLNLNELPGEIGKMIFLRYIGLKNCGHVIFPSSMKHLINLQTFDARDTYISSLHSSFWKIPTLRHVYMYHDGSEMLLPKHGELQNIEKLHLVFGEGISSISNTRKFITMLGKQESKIFSLYLECAMSPYQFLAVLSSHHNLQELGIRGKMDLYTTGYRTLPNNTLFPPNLRKLKLSNIHLSVDPMRILELLPSLVILRLGLCTYNGDIMSCSTGGFPRLQHMSVEGFYSLKKWKIEAGAMPRLSKLKLKDCWELELRPEELEHLPVLEEIELIDMGIYSEETYNKLVEIGRNVIFKNVQLFRMDGSRSTL